MLVEVCMDVLMSRGERCGRRPDGTRRVGDRRGNVSSELTRICLETPRADALQISKQS